MLNFIATSSAVASNFSPTLMLYSRHWKGWLKDVGDLNQAVCSILRGWKCHLQRSQAKIKVVHQNRQRASARAAIKLPRGIVVSCDLLKQEAAIDASQNESRPTHWRAPSNFGGCQRANPFTRLKKSRPRNYTEKSAAVHRQSSSIYWLEYSLFFRTPAHREGKKLGVQASHQFLRLAKWMALCARV
jgi:hypothetical protein